MEKRDTLFIGGEFMTPSSNRTIEVISPYTEEIIGVAPEADEEDIDRAVAAARAAFDDGGWASTDSQERSEMLRAISAGISGRMTEFAELITAENGCPATFSMMGQVMAATMALEAFADVVWEYPFEEHRQGMLGPNLVLHQPVGVSVGIVPWNVPLFISLLKLGAAIGAGSPMVLKPAPETPLDAYLLAEVCQEAGLPAGMLSVVPGGREIGEYLVRHPGVDKVSFTGSTAAGRKIGSICGEQLKRCTLELGGKSAAVMLDDVNLDEALPMLMPSAIMNNGQACLAQTRILVPRSREDEINEALAEAVGSMTVGDPSQETTEVGPLVAERQRDRVEGYLAAGRDEGATVAVGGGRPADQDRGWFVEPTLFTGVDNGMKIAQEEIFGPVLVSIPYDDQADAIRIANDSDFGLSGSVWTGDTHRGIELAKSVRTGTYGVNSVGTMDMKSPFGGFKSSGMGRECGPEGLAAFLETQTLVLPGDYDGAPPPAA